PQHTYMLATERPARMAEWCDYAQTFDNTNEAICELNLKVNGDWDAPVRPDEGEWFKNVWFGARIHNQQTADERIPHLLRCPAAVRFLSCEPLLEDVDLANAYDGQLFDMAMKDAFATGRINPDEVIVHTERDTGVTHSSHEEALPGIDWVIVGGESGPGARPCYLSWIEGIIAQCETAGVPCFVEQLGSFAVAD